jgi:hypothetical protein
MLTYFIEPGTFLKIIKNVTRSTTSTTFGIHTYPGNETSI